MLGRREFLQSAAVGLSFSASVETRNFSCILLNLVGGPSHLDTWDMKPDAPVEIRGPYKPVRTNVPGIEISEIFPRMARNADKFSILRSVYQTGPAVHDSPQLLAGFGTLVQPDGAGVEPESVRDKYGRNRFGRSCLQARRLIEGEASFVRVNMFRTVYDQITWDIHGPRPFSPMRCYGDIVGPMFDNAYTSLLEDLSDRGLLASTIVVATGEFGRTPKLNSSGGRDHWPACWSVLISGGPLKCGIVVGASDTIGAEPKDRPVTPADIEATICKALGITVGCAGQPISELFI